MQNMVIALSAGTMCSTFLLTGARVTSFGRSNGRVDNKTTMGKSVLQSSNDSLEVGFVYIKIIQLMVCEKSL